MSKKASRLAVVVISMVTLIVTLSSCVSLNQNININSDTYKIEQVLKNIAVNPRQSHFLLLEPENINRDSLEIVSEYDAIEPKQLTRKTAHYFHDKPVYAKKYTSELLLDGQSYRKRQGEVYYDTKSYRRIGYKSFTDNTEEMLTTFHEMPMFAEVGDSGKVSEGYVTYKLSIADNELGKATIEIFWALNKVDSKTANFCETSIISYPHHKSETFDKTTDCYLINKQGDILGSDVTVTMMPKNENRLKMEFISK